MCVSVCVCVCVCVSVSLCVCERGGGVGGENRPNFPVQSSGMEIRKGWQRVKSENTLMMY